ncbi:hypothetical protein RHGRI_007816 [Rhododendron griersonianum]|uniref:Secreted protein n=1 Tax=Rhododendron griersonianum TaxID=479676 RepID=A0AAV6KYB2_9ERIC|nr:hypothetical protein RHGRI_007816 [Rhododendron griersonianum]
MALSVVWVWHGSGCWWPGCGVVAAIGVVWSRSALLGSCLDSLELNPWKSMSSLPDAALVAAAQHVGFLAEGGGVVGVL